MADHILLMFAYHFPPENVIGALRPFQFCKYLSRMGYRCHVITAASQASLAQNDVQFVADPFLTPSSNRIAWHLERAVRRFLIPGVTGIVWSRLAFRAGRAFLRSHPGAEATIISTYPPLGAHLAALQLSRSTKIRWIADFRDPLADNPGHIGFSKFQQDICRRLERAILRMATIAIVNTDALAKKLKDSYQAKSVHLIWNGFDPEDLIQPEPLSTRDYKLVSHVGALYEGRTITPLLESLSRLVDRGQLKPANMRLRLVGPIRSDSLPSPEFLSRAKEQGWLEIIPKQVPKGEARLIAAGSDGLLLVQPHSAVQVPGKLFEYLRFGRPIFAYILPNTPIERILKQSGVTYRCAYADSSQQELDNTVLSFFNLKTHASPANGWFRDNFDVSKQTKTLEALIRLAHTDEPGIPAEPKAHEEDQVNG